MQNKEITTINQESICNEGRLLEEKIKELVVREKSGEDVSKENKDISKELVQHSQKFEKLMENELLKPSEGTPLLDELRALHSLNRLTDIDNCKDIAKYARMDMQPKNFIEHILIDQITVTHVHALKMISRIEARMAEGEGVPTDLIQKRMNLSIRMFETSQKAALALNKLRTAGTQTVIVKHHNVQVNDGGQAIIADTLVTREGVANDKK